ncbi:hypothetical protein JCM6882_003360 [Rhodosporidiobolus microsporus]
MLTGPGTFEWWIDFPDRTHFGLRVTDSAGVWYYGPEMWIERHNGNLMYCRMANEDEDVAALAESLEQLKELVESSTIAGWLVTLCVVMVLLNICHEVVQGFMRSRKALEDDGEVWLGIQEEDEVEAIPLAMDQGASASEKGGERV